MKSYRLQSPTLFLLVLLAVFALSCGSAGDAAKSNDHANIQGVWLGQKESLNGVEKEVNFQYVFSADKFTFTDETGKEFSYSYTLDTLSNPRLFIIHPVVMDGDTISVGVGYELKGDSLKIVVAPPKMRPLDISDNNNQELITCTRKRS